MSSSVDIHPSAIVHPGAKLGAGTSVGPFSVVGEHVVTGENCDIQEHVVLRGHITLADDVQVFPHAVLGGAPQHGQYKGEPTGIEIGDRSIIREGVTIHLGTTFGNNVTRVGSDSLLMAYCHVAHDCIIGNHVILANAVQLAGHVTLEDHVTLGGHSAMVQFCRIGRYCYVGGGSILRKDILPFMTGKGTEFQVQGVNAVGLKRKGFADETISALRKIHKIFYRQNLTANSAIQKIKDEVGEGDESKVIIDFIESSKAGFIR